MFRVHNKNTRKKSSSPSPPPKKKCYKWKLEVDSENLHAQRVIKMGRKGVEPSRSLSGSKTFGVSNASKLAKNGFN